MIDDLSTALEDQAEEDRLPCDGDCERCENKPGSLECEVVKETTFGPTDADELWAG
jgi:hypothetical protein